MRYTLFFILLVYIFHSIISFGASSISILTQKCVFLTSLKFHYVNILCLLNQFPNVQTFQMCLIHCHYKQCYSEYLFIYVNFAQVQVYPWDKFLEVILLVLKNMYIWNFVNSCPSQSLHQFTISSIMMTTLVSPYPLQQCELENVWFCQRISFLKRHLIVLI